MPATHAISAKTPKGVSSITIMVTFCITTLPLSKIVSTGWPSSFAIRMPMPSRSENTISGRTLTSAITCTGLCGIMPRIMSLKVVSLGGGVTPMSIAEVSTPAPGWTRVPRPSPSQTAICPVTTNSSIARQPTLPSFLRSPMLATPATRLKKISGTTSILMKAMKISPMILMLAASGPHSRPRMTPSTSAAITRCHKGIRNQVFMLGQAPSWSQSSLARRAPDPHRASDIRNFAASKRAPGMAEGKVHFRGASRS